MGDDAPAFEDVESFAEWSSDYYASPTPERLPRAVEYLFKSDLFEDDPGLYWPMASFFGGCYANNQDAAADAVDHALASDDPYLQTFVISSLWQANTDHCRDEIVRAGERLSQPRMTGLVERLLNTPPLLADEDITLQDYHLDMLWGRFQATGEAAPVHRVIDAIGGFDHNDGRLVVAGAARWSLGSQARDHALVYKVVAERAKTEENETIRKELDIILSEIDAEQAEQP